MAGILFLSAGGALSQSDEENLLTAMQDETRALSAPGLDAVWYPPRRPVEGTRYPVAILLGSKETPVASDSFWVRTLWERNFCTLVLQCEDDRWGHLRIARVLEHLNRPPAKVPADADRLLCIADEHSGTIVKRLIPAYPSRIAGAVLVNVSPVELTPRGYRMWSPGEPGWSVPLWAVVGASPKNPTARPRLWRKLRRSAPDKASITVDPRIGRSGGPLLPNRTIGRWLDEIAAGKTPEPGPDAQVEREKRKYADFARRLREHLAVAAGSAGPGETFTKTEGPYTITVTAPSGWQRVENREKSYNPAPRAPVEETGNTADSSTSPYSVIYLTPSPADKFFAKVRAGRWTHPPEELIDRHALRLVDNGYLHVPLASWREGEWAYEIATIQLLWRKQWHRWVVLSAAISGKANDPSAALIMVMDSSGSPDPAAMSSAMKRLTRSAKTSWRSGGAVRLLPLGQ